MHFTIFVHKNLSPTLHSRNFTIKPFKSQYVYRKKNLKTRRNLITLNTYPHTQPTFNYFNIGSTLYCIALQYTVLTAECTALHCHTLLYCRIYFKLVSSAPYSISSLFTHYYIFHDRRRTLLHFSRSPYIFAAFTTIAVQFCCRLYKEKQSEHILYLF